MTLRDTSNTCPTCPLPNGFHEMTCPTLHKENAKYMPNSASTAPQDSGEPSQEAIDEVVSNALDKVAEAGLIERVDSGEPDDNSTERVDLYCTHCGMPANASSTPQAQGSGDGVEAIFEPIVMQYVAEPSNRGTIIAEAKAAIELLLQKSERIGFSNGYAAGYDTVGQYNSTKAYEEWKAELQSNLPRKDKA